MKYSPELVKVFCDNLKLGMSRTDSCALVDISKETLSSWMGTNLEEKKRKGRHPGAPFRPEFRIAVIKAELECKKRCIGIIQKAAITTWTAAAWWLERKHRDEFALRQEITGKDGEAIATKSECTISDGTLKALGEAIVRAKIGLIKG